MSRAKRFLGLSLALVALLSFGGCYGASVGVYGTGYYGPGAWGGYPYPGRYPPMGGGVFVGVCCDDEEEQQQQEEQPQDGDADASDESEETPSSPEGPAGY
jgi:hypothetical protein